MVWLFLWNPGEFNMLGANGSFSAKVFFCSKTLALRKSAALPCGAPFRAASFLSTHDKIEDLMQKCVRSLIFYIKSSGSRSCTFWKWKVRWRVAVKRDLYENAESHREQTSKKPWGRGKRLHRCQASIEDWRDDSLRLRETACKIYQSQPYQHGVRNERVW